jgi:hypothetical protein
MRTVRDEDGNRYLLLKESSESSLVHDPKAGDSRYLPNDELEDADGESTLEAAASGVPTSVRKVMTAVHNDRHLGLLMEIDRQKPISARDLIETYDLCESDLNGLLSELQITGLIELTEVGATPYYRTTDETHAALADLRE